jgi:hypothetical protein
MRAYTEFEATNESLPQRMNVDDPAGATGYLKTSSPGLGGNLIHPSMTRIAILRGLLAQ